MEQETKRVEEGIDIEDTTVDYVAAIKELKENSVSRAQYEKLRTENQQLLSSLINGETMQATAPKKEIDTAKIEKMLRDKSSHIKNLDYVQAILDLREADIAAGKPDPFLSVSNKSCTQADLDKAQEIADIYQECIDYAEGDSGLFTQELNRRMVDVPLPKRKK